MNKYCECITCAARYVCRYSIPGTETGCDRPADVTVSQVSPVSPVPNKNSMSNNKKQCGKPQKEMHKSKEWWLKLAKNERQHAYDNKGKCKDKGDDYGVQVYTVRIKALDLYIKNLQNKEAV